VIVVVANSLYHIRAELPVFSYLWVITTEPGGQRSSMVGEREKLAV
jgi:hypothetical protein